MNDVERLEEYADLCNDEYGEYCIALCEMFSHSDFLSASLRKHLETELKYRLHDFDTNYIITEKVELVAERTCSLELL